MNDQRNPRTRALSEAGVSIWLDDLSRQAMTSGDLAELIATRDVVGVTTNPSIFQAAIAGVSVYDEDIARLAGEGKDAEAVLGRAHLTVNKNSVPNDPKSPFVTSGLRLGTPAITTRGYKEADCVALANWIADVLDNPHDAAAIERVKAEVKVLTDKYPVYAA